MKFTIDFDKAPTLPSLFLMVGLVFSAFLSIWLVLHFISWEFPNNTYFRGVLVDVVVVLTGAYLNGKYPQEG